MKKILIDTNFFLAPFQTGVNIMSEFDRIMQEPFKLMTLQPLKEELENLAKNGKGDEKTCANLGLQLAENIPAEEARGGGDDAILLYLRDRKDIIVATNDSKLRKRLKAKRVRTIYVRNRSVLELE